MNQQHQPDAIEAAARAGKDADEGRLPDPENPKYRSFPQPLSVCTFSIDTARNMALACLLTFLCTLSGLVLLLISEKSQSNAMSLPRGLVVGAPFFTGGFAVGAWRVNASYGLYRMPHIIGLGLLIFAIFITYATFPALNPADGHCGIIIIFSVGLPTCVIFVDGFMIATAAPSNKAFTKNIGPVLGVSWAATAGIFLIYNTVSNALKGSSFQGLVLGLLLSFLTWLYELLLTKFYTRAYLNGIYYKHVAAVVRRRWLNELVLPINQSELTPLSRGSTILQQQLDHLELRIVNIDPTSTEVSVAQKMKYLPEREKLDFDIKIPDGLVPPLGDQETTLSFNILVTLALSQASRLAPLISKAVTGDYYISLSIATAVSGTMLNVFSRVGWQHHVLAKVGIKHTAFDKALGQGRFFICYPRFLPILCIGLAKFAIVTGDPWDLVLGQNSALALAIACSASIAEDFITYLVLSNDRLLPPPAVAPANLNENHPYNATGIYTHFRQPHFSLYMGIVSFSFTMVIFIAVLQVGFDQLFGFCPLADVPGDRGWLWWWPLSSPHHPQC